MNIGELRELVERKTETLTVLEALLEREDAELVELERKLEALEDEEEEGPAGEPSQGP
jgi:predicted RNase H-like nuclease (RuvC/YqgF family)